MKKQKFHPSFEEWNPCFTLCSLWLNFKMVDYEFNW